MRKCEEGTERISATLYGRGNLHKKIIALYIACLGGDDAFFVFDITLCIYKTLLIALKPSQEDMSRKNGIYRNEVPPSPARDNQVCP